MGRTSRWRVSAMPPAVIGEEQRSLKTMAAALKRNEGEHHCSCDDDLNNSGNARG